MKKTRLHKLLADERGLEVVQYVAFGAIMLALIATVYGVFNNNGRLRNAIRGTISYYAVNFGRDISVAGPCVPGTRERQPIASRGGCGSQPVQEVLFDPRNNRVIAFRPDTNEPVVVQAEPWQRISVDPTTKQVVIFDPEAKREIRFDPLNWQAVAVNTVTKAETPLQISLFSQTLKDEVAQQVEGFQVNNLLAVRFTPTNDSPVATAPQNWLATATNGVPMLVATTRPISTQQQGGQSFLAAAVMGFLGTLVVGAAAAVVVGLALFALSLIAPEVALVVGAGLLVAAVGYLLVQRWQQFAQQGKPWYAYPLLPLLALGDLTGITGIIEGITGRDIVSGATLAAGEAGNRLGSGIAGALLTLFTAGTARAGGVGARGATSAAAGESGWLARLWSGIFGEGAGGAVSRRAPGLLSWLDRVRIKLPNGQVLGWGEFDISISKLWTTKRSFTPWDKQVMSEIASRITQLPEFNPKVWATATRAERRQAARTLMNIVMEAHGIPKSRYPRFSIKPLGPNDYGWADWTRTDTRGELAVNSTKAIGDIVGTIVHEGRHYYQMWQAYQHLELGRPLSGLHPHTAEWIKNLPSFGGKYHISGRPYFTQPIEKDAESFGRRVIDLLPVRWPRPAPQPAPVPPPVPNSPAP